MCARPSAGANDWNDVLRAMQEREMSRQHGQQQENSMNDDMLDRYW